MKIRRKYRLDRRLHEIIGDNNLTDLIEDFEKMNELADRGTGYTDFRSKNMTEKTYKSIRGILLRLKKYFDK